MDPDLAKRLDTLEEKLDILLKRVPDIALLKRERLEKAKVELEKTQQEFKDRHQIPDTIVDQIVKETRKGRDYLLFSKKGCSYCDPIIKLITKVTPKNDVNIFYVDFKEKKYRNLRRLYQVVSTPTAVFLEDSKVVAKGRGIKCVEILNNQ